MQFLTSSDTAYSQISPYNGTTAEYIAASETRTERKYLTKLCGQQVTSESDPEVWVRIGTSQKIFL